jgi:hypothetical protein
MSDGLHNHLALEQIQRSVTEIEGDASRGQYVWNLIGDVANVARLLGGGELATRALRVLHESSPPEYYLKRAARSVEELERDYPLYQESRILDMMQAAALREPHLALALEGRYDQALANAEWATEVEEIGETRAVRGDFEGAVLCLQLLAEPGCKHFGVGFESRQKALLVVIAIELFRRGLNEQAQIVLSDLESRRIESWYRVNLAVGLAGREPWQGYPYPDY